jgi:hypothetical protein
MATFRYRSRTRSVCMVCGKAMRRMEVARV